MNRQIWQTAQGRATVKSRVMGPSLLRSGLIAASLAVMVGCSAQKDVTTYAASKAAEATATATTFIPIEGMSCGSCAATVKRTVKAIDGVTEVEVSLEHRGARVSYVAREVSPDRIAAAINQLGYKAGQPRAEP